MLVSITLHTVSVHCYVCFDIVILCHCEQLSFRPRRRRPHLLKITADGAKNGLLASFLSDHTPAHEMPLLIYIQSTSSAVQASSAEESLQKK